MWLLQSLIRRNQLPVHGEREAEQAAWISAPSQDIVGVQVESRESSASQEKDDRPQSTGDPALHEIQSNTKKTTTLNW